MGGVRRENIFYNQELKDKYLDDVEPNKRAALKRIFLASYEQEKNLGKDLYAFNESELLQLYSFINTTSVNVLYNLHRLVCTYMDLVDPENKQSHTDATQRINKTRLKNYCNKVAQRIRILSKEEVYDIIEQPEFQNNMDKFIVLCLFEGIKGTNYCELLELKSEDLNMKDGKCYADLCTGRTVEISEKLYFIAKLAADTDTYSFIRGEVMIDMPLENTGYIFRRTLNTNGDQHSKGKTLQVRMIRIFKHMGYENQISMKSIFDSGLVDYLGKVAKENGITVKECLDDLVLWEKVYLRYGYIIRNPKHKNFELYRIKYEIEQYVM